MNPPTNVIKEFESEVSGRRRPVRLEEKTLMTNS
jgi:hypothetical protein